MDFISKFMARVGQLRKREYWSRQEIEAYQARTLARMRKFAYANSRFYQSYHKGLMNKPLQELPSVSKAMLMEHFDEIVTDAAIRHEEMEKYLETDRAGKLFLDRYYLTASSGTSGNRALFLANSSEWLTSLASMSRQGLWMDLKQVPRKRRVAYALSKVPWHASSRFLHFVNQNLTSILVLDAADPVDRIMQALNEFQPELLTAYASLAKVLAEEQLQGRLRIQPEIVCTGGDVLTQEVYQRIVKAWHKTPYNGYAATESSVLAAECSHHSGMHMFEDMVIIENVDRKGNAVPPGEYGEKVLITVPFRRTIPLIRYELDDVIRIGKGACPCGRTLRLIDDIKGRIYEAVWLTRPSGGRVAFHPNFFCRILDALPISEWQVVHHKLGLDVLIRNPRPDLTDRFVDETLTREFKAGGALPPSINVKRVSHIPRGKTGKAVLVRMEV